jgi:hypothetical protein
MTDSAITSLSSQKERLGLHNGQFLDQSSLPLVEGTHYALCDLAEMFYSVMLHNTNESNKTGDTDDINKRKELYGRVVRWRSVMPRKLREDENFAPQTCYLRYV